jgi:hypothetical protein
MKRIRTSVLFILSEVIFNLFLSSIFAYTNVYTQQNSNVLAAEVNGRILVNDINNEKVSTIIQINTTSGLEALGGATLVIGFDTSTISIKALPVKNIDYVFHNFCGGNYSAATVTRPMNNCIWINIDLPFQKSNQGTLVAGGNNWTDVVTIIFDVVDPHGFANIYWLPNIVYWGVYDDDNITVWKVGRFQDALNVPLPVELSSFTAKLLDDIVQLKWSTETEVNNYGFDVERKVNGINWNKIGFVVGNGNSNSRKYYSFTDNNLTGGNIFYYRLKQIDTDGKFEYSEIIELEYSPKNFALYQNYPNPFNPSTRIKYSLAKSSDVVLKIFDVLGNEVANLVEEFLPAGSYEVEFGSTSLPSGIYLYKLRANSFADTKKMILIK